MEKFKNVKRNKGMTYIELIVVLSIFSVMTSIVLFNYGAFEANINIKILAHDIASRIVEAQKSSVSGKLPPMVQQTFIGSNPWKPSYGIYFNPTVNNNKSFVYFVDLPVQNGFYDSSACGGNGECLDNVVITKGNYISNVATYTNNSPTSITAPISITFKRPNSKAIFFSNGAELNGFDYLKITVSAPNGTKSYINIYPSGRIEVI